MAVSGTFHFSGIAVCVWHTYYSPFSANFGILCGARIVAFVGLKNGGLLVAMLILFLVQTSGLGITGDSN